MTTVIDAHSIQIRKATENDLATLLDFEQGIIAAERPYDETLRAGEIHYYDLAALLGADHTRVVVAMLGQQLVGSGWAQLRDSVPYVDHTRHAFLGFMYVVPQVRGRGVNARIVDALADWAKDQGVTELVLEVYPTNHQALRAYSKAGFQPHLLEMRRRLQVD